MLDCQSYFGNIVLLSRSGNNKKNGIPRASQVFFFFFFDCSIFPGNLDSSLASMSSGWENALREMSDMPTASFI